MQPPQAKHNSPYLDCTVPTTTIIHRQNIIYEELEHTSVQDNSIVQRSAILHIIIWRTTIVQMEVIRRRREIIILQTIVVIQRILFILQTIQRTIICLQATVIQKTIILQTI